VSFHERQVIAVARRSCRFIDTCSGVSRPTGRRSTLDLNGADVINNSWGCTSTCPTHPVRQ